VHRSASTSRPACPWARKPRPRASRAPGPALEASTYCSVDPSKRAARAPAGPAGRVPGPVRRGAGHHPDRDAVLCDVRVLQGPPGGARPRAGALAVSPLNVICMNSRAMGLGRVRSGVLMEIGAWALMPASALPTDIGCLPWWPGLGGSLDAPQPAKQWSMRWGQGGGRPTDACQRWRARRPPSAPLRRAGPAARANGDACGGRCPHTMSLARRR
jgi:hypothetical protein